MLLTLYLANRNNQWYFIGRKERLVIGEDPYLQSFVAIPPLSEGEIETQTKEEPPVVEEENLWEKPRTNLEQMEGGHEVTRFL